MGGIITLLCVTMLSVYAMITFISTVKKENYNFDEYVKTLGAETWTIDFTDFSITEIRPVENCDNPRDC